MPEASNFRIGRRNQSVFSRLRHPSTANHNRRSRTNFLNEFPTNML